ncbi:hypothetical protein L198_01309 [Cryptococcus wingfieldii CBS 7118]|uniref:AB hydrolase-1 domain-containing protein n=1 Tax=Cryptococcus wingfieldii CBS 7118 TaxID=1295528 RepID=A0A1E3JZ07_9TREE|nr:hypothetical protein L198_01309 [Cryptococcus wingfieldii CBS 7118]ODO06080.1 hypothetical protein L198_01309 [Cryptococcus wingfieldii CBS 7118]
MTAPASDPYPDAPLSFIGINGARLAYRLKGEPELPLLITLHGGRGFGSHDGDFAAFHPLSDTFRVLSFDFRGHGQSSPTYPYTFKQIVDDIEGLRRHFAGDEKAVILGGSFGGFIAQQYAITYPDSVSHLLLRGTAPSHHHEKEALENIRRRAATKAPMASENYLKKIFGTITDDNEFRIIMFAIGPLYLDGAYDADKALESSRKTIYNAESHNSLYSEKEKYFDYREGLKTLSIPTLIFVGEHDWITPPCTPASPTFLMPRPLMKGAIIAQSKLIHERAPNSKLVIFPNANHSVHHDKNAEVLKLIRDFVSSSTA